MNPLLKPQELASLLGVAVSFVYDRTCRKTTDPIPHVKIGKYVRFDIREIEEWVKQRLRIPVPETANQM